MGFRMNKVWKRNNKFIVVMFTSIFIATTVLMVFSILSVTSYNKSLTSELVVSLKNTYMKETIDNLVIRIGTMEDDNVKLVEHPMNYIRIGIEQYPNMDIECMENLIDINNHDTHQINALVYDAQSEELVYETIEEANSQINTTDKINKIRNTSATYVEVSAGQNIVILYVTWEDIYTMTKAQVYEEIYNMNYEKNQYVWVHKIINYDGGDDYAIRLIYPKLQESEGEYISTNVQDVDGNFPYQNELDGIKEHGEIFHQYVLEDPQNGDLIKKISYAYLYEKYDWVIATGIPVEDLDELVAEIESNGTSFISQNVICMVVIFAIGIMGSLFFLIRKQKKYVVSLQSIVREETEIDVLTGAFSRKYGTSYSKKVFAEFMAKGINTTFFILDIDDFKIVNDTYGHAVGDTVLKQMTQTILGIVSSKDCLIRWGGEEFVLVVNDVTKKESLKIANSIVENVAHMEFNGNDSTFKITVSIGGVCF